MISKYDFIVYRNAVIFGLIIIIGLLIFCRYLKNKKELIRAIEQKLEAEEKAEKLANYDTLTGLANRQSFNEQLEKAISEVYEKSKQMAVLFLDFDRFKVINDTLGHDVGDLLLQKIADRLIGLIGRKSIVSRMGGDEFIILLSKIDYIWEAENIAKKILQCFDESISLNKHEVFITASIGISFYPGDGKESMELIKNADTAMYKAKAKGGNNYQIYFPTMNEKALERLNLENDLRRAIEKNELYLTYQPKVSLKSGKVIGSETLLRWKHTLKGHIPPSDFIPLAEETGLILPIGKWVLNEACKQIRLWKDKGFKNLRMSINISPQQFLRGNLVEDVKEAIAVWGIEGSYLDLEITESCLMENTERNMEIVRQLKELKAEISVDDFGKGFSSLSYLKMFKVDVLKIDSSFIKDIPFDSNDMAITTAIINMAHDLNLSVVAEGVETEEQLAFLMKKGCDELQGFYFSRPLLNEAFEELIYSGKELFKEENNKNYSI